VNNCRRLRDQFKTPAIFNPLFNSIAAMAKINQEKGNEIPHHGLYQHAQSDRDRQQTPGGGPSPLHGICKTFSDIAWEKGWRKAAMVATVGALRRGMAGRFQGILAEEGRRDYRGQTG